RRALHRLPHGARDARPRRPQAHPRDRPVGNLHRHLPDDGRRPDRAGQADAGAERPARRVAACGHFASERKTSMSETTESLEIKATAGPAGEPTFADFMAAFEAFKRGNDERLAEIERRGAADPLTDEKLERINAAL